jgi:hypothetical protein
MTNESVFCFNLMANFISLQVFYQNPKMHHSVRMKLDLWNVPNLIHRPVSSGLLQVSKQTTNMPLSIICYRFNREWLKIIIIILNINLSEYVTSVELMCYICFLFMTLSLLHSYAKCIGEFYILCSIQCCNLHLTYAWKMSHLDVMCSVCDLVFCLWK